jgi:hypothetical protein
MLEKVQMRSQSGNRRSDRLECATKFHDGTNGLIHQWEFIPRNLTRKRLEGSFLWSIFQRLWHVRLPNIAALCDSRGCWYPTVQISVPSRLYRVSLDLGFHFHHIFLAIQESVKIHDTFLLKYLLVCYKMKRNSSIPRERDGHQLRTAFESTPTIESNICENWNMKNHWVIRMRRTHTFSSFQNLISVPPEK